MGPLPSGKCLVLGNYLLVPASATTPMYNGDVILNSIKLLTINVIKISSAANPYQT